MFKNALVSCSNKQGLAEFLKKLLPHGLRIVSTGGTAEYLRKNHIPVVEVSEQTGFPEVMDGRVRTLHPLIHMPLLARSDNPYDMEILSKHSLQRFDLVIGNLYPFEEHSKKGLSDKELSEFIDIGGPALLRAAAKNYFQTTVICDPQDYDIILSEPELSLDRRKFLAAKVFSHISSYDSNIANYLSGNPLQQKEMTIGGQLIQPLRYGENPHQDANWLKENGSPFGIHNAKILSGKPLSYNNLLDINSAAELIKEFKRPTCVAIKHNNTCGASSSDNIFQAVKNCMKADPISIFGGIVMVNKTVELDVAEQLAPIFLECVVAPQFTPEAFQKLTTKKNLRLLEWDSFQTEHPYQIRSVLGGYLIQTTDQVDFEWNPNWTLYGKEPSIDLKRDLLFAWKVCAHLKSNAIALARNESTLGLGMGQVNRIDAVDQSIQRWKKYHSHISDPVLASDAFFPFSDSIERAAEAGIKWVIQPGGSVKDDEVIAAAKRLDVSMIFTHKRHFKH